MASAWLVSSTESHTVTILRVVDVLLLVLILLAVATGLAALIFHDVPRCLCILQRYRARTRGTRERMGSLWLPVSPLEQGPGIDAQGPGLELFPRTTPSLSESEYTIEDEEQGKEKGKNRDSSAGGSLRGVMTIDVRGSIIGGSIDGDSMNNDDGDNGEKKDNSPIIEEDIVFSPLQMSSRSLVSSSPSQSSGFMMLPVLGSCLSPPRHKDHPHSPPHHPYHQPHYHPHQQQHRQQQYQHRLLQVTDPAYTLTSDQHGGKSPGQGFGQGPLLTCITSDAVVREALRQEALVDYDDIPIQFHPLKSPSIHTMGQHPSPHISVDRKGVNNSMSVQGGPEEGVRKGVRFVTPPQSPLMQ